MKLELPENVTGLRLCRIRGEDLVLCEPVQFVRGLPAVDTVFRRAAISGTVGPVGETGDWWADLIDKDGDWSETIALDAGSYKALKTKWAKCRVQS